MTTFQPSTALRPLGSSDLSVSPLAWGMWRFGAVDAATARRLVEAAVAAGITLFDTADIYGTDAPGGAIGLAETKLGQILREAPALRDQLVIATKGGIVDGGLFNSSGSHLAAAVDASLARLGVDRIDLYQIHRRDFLAHPQEVAGALARMVESGKVRTVGVSNHSPRELDALQAFLSIPLASTQPELSPVHIAPFIDGTVDQAMQRNLAVLAWSPLGGGQLAIAENPVTRLLVEQAGRFGVDIAAAALSWIMVHPAGIIPIIGSQRPERVAASVDAFKVQWTRAQWYGVGLAAYGLKQP